MNLLFVCTENRLRSATAETALSKFEGITAIGCGTNKDAITPVSGDLILWADVVFVMQKMHYKKVMAKYKDLLKEIPLITLGIPDNYNYMDDELVTILERKVSRFVELRRKTENEVDE